MRKLLNPLGFVNRLSAQRADNITYSALSRLGERDLQHIYVRLKITQELFVLRIPSWNIVCVRPVLKLNMIIGSDKEAGS